MAGRKIVMRVHDGGDPGQMVAIATLKSKSISLNNETFDNTSDSDVDAFDQLWEASVDGVSSMGVSGDGRTRGREGEKRLNAIFFSSDRCADGELVVPGLGVYACNLRLESFEVGGETKTDSTFSFSLKSNGAVVFTAEE
ncbi:phage tail tube protein [Shimia thalassica]|uniref:phage tail tube protein n=1 Tax=Shimia thalassica TaxID=1715693 RepID=UPI001C0835F7|nr:phage tail tube protein [Shimia thalassica]MBU2941413.1 phage tail protein [Shimia thalassica]MDO6486030.1 phage tail tube protein [Shimia thalassica]MDO6505003.1 phage tail tube protein [Shimia thalassica]MDO6523266.1 phage tail tube protein [Shimia thalassica]